MDSMQLVTPAIGLMFWTVVIFILLLLILKKFAWKPILKAVDDRNNSIKEALSSAENAKKEGVTVTASGLQYEVIASGSGATPTLSDTVETHYTGRFMDGTEFDSSVTRGQPLTFPVTGVIAGWTEALQLMQEGDKWKLYIPSELAYGERGVGPIPPNATLIFDIELLAVK